MANAKPATLGVTRSQRIAATGKVYVDIAKNTGKARRLGVTSRDLAAKAKRTRATSPSWNGGLKKTSRAGGLEADRQALGVPVTGLLE